MPKAWLNRKEKGIEAMANQERKWQKKIAISFAL